MRRGRQENEDGTTTLWRPIGPSELALLRLDGFRAWPPRLAEQPIFYPVLNEEYATTIARDWNVAASGTGYVTRFRVETATARRYPTQVAGGAGHLELWVPAEELEAFNAAIVGRIEIVAEYSAGV
ncbi:ADP-ribosylation/crystallin J1 [Catenulispora subtropica]|uniref:ADP-ribosylation/crystallin J1 n=1 Tax=Catenulispora subtropica TaxID=450798 RepID=UPI0031D5BBE8